MKEIILSERPLIRAYNGDCMEFMQNCDKYELAICDPPYGGAGKDFKVKDKVIRTGGNWAKKYQNNKENVIVNWDIAPDEKYFELLFEKTENQIIWGGNYFRLPANRHFLIWQKHIPENFSMAMCEYAWSSFNENAKIYKHNSTNPARFHPTQKPIQLYKWILSNYAKSGDKILDTHGGSMSIAIACYDLGFDLDIIELDKEYFEQAVKRVQRHISQQSLFKIAEKDTETLF